MIYEMWHLLRITFVIIDISEEKSIFGTFMKSALGKLDNVHLGSIFVKVFMPFRSIKII